MLKLRNSFVFWSLLVGMLFVFTTPIVKAAANGEALDIIANDPGGVLVLLGCEDSELIEAAAKCERLVVQCLDTDPARVAAARQQIESTGSYGQISADLLTGDHLPYIDGTINRIVVTDQGKITSEEISRVLCPGGQAILRSGSTWKTSDKPVPADIDEWTHYMHDPSNNAVAHDTQVGPPRRMQWVAGPRYSRHHDRMSSVSAVVTSGGRIFSIIDEATKSSIMVPPRWRVVARDAYNGRRLWSRDISKWHTTLWPLKSGPAQLPRRLVAVGDRVYCPLSLYGKTVELDAATGETLRTFEVTDGTEEIIVDGDMLFVQTDKATDKPDDGSPDRFKRAYGAPHWRPTPRDLYAIDLKTGNTIWTAHEVILPITVAVDDKNVIYHNGDVVVCRDRITGNVRWRSQPVPRSEIIRSYFAPTLVLYDGMILFAGGETAGNQTGGGLAKGKDTMSGIDAETGRVVWTAPHPPSGYRSPEDLMVIDGLVWTGATINGGQDGRMVGRDPRTGEIQREFLPDVETYWFHHRCHRGKATDNYILTSRTGIEFIDLEKETWDINHWVRGACLYGIMPANGLIYAPPHPCACYLESKLSGMTALAPVAEDGQVARTSIVADDVRLEKGPAYDLMLAADHATSNDKTTSLSGDWPMYRCDVQRSGNARSKLADQVKPAWQVQLGGRLSQPVVADGQLLVSQIDSHKIHALETKSGNPIWTFTAGARVDSPPTVYGDRVLFGSTDGYIYCLRATDGALVWRFLAAPTDQRLLFYEQIESVWPVHGSVLIVDGTLYAVAGRSAFLDGGMTLWRLDPRTGSIIGKTQLDEKEFGTDKELQDYIAWLNMPPALPDILSFDGTHVYMRSQPFTKNGTPLPLFMMGTLKGGPPAPHQDASLAHLFSPTGFLDDTWWHRTYWMYGSRFVSGWNGYYLSGKAAPAGRILVFDEKRIYGFGRLAEFYRWTVPIEHQLFSTDRKIADLTSGQIEDLRRMPSVVRHQWNRPMPIFARAMTLAGETLAVAGPPDLLKETAMMSNMEQVGRPETQTAQAEAIEGLRGGRLQLISTKDGEIQADYKLASPPIFDGMIVAGGQLYMSTVDGTVTCFVGGR